MSEAGQLNDGAQRDAERHAESEGDRGDQRRCGAQPVRPLREGLERRRTGTLRLDEPMDAARRQQHDRGLGSRKHGAEHAEHQHEHDHHRYHVVSELHFGVRTNRSLSEE